MTTRTLELSNRHYLAALDPFKMSNNYESSRLTTRGTTVYNLVAELAEHNPGAVAVLGPGRDPLTYGALQAQIEYVVRSLRSAGIGRNDRVALVLPNGPDTAVAFLGTVAGATSAPLSPDLRENEYRSLLSGLNVRALIVESGSDSPARAAASDLNVPIIELVSKANTQAGRFSLDVDKSIASQEVVCDYAEPDDIALVLHTSGTTSDPKIVPLSHANICASAHYVAQNLQLTADDRCLNVMPLFHVHGLVAAVLASLDASSSVVCSSGFFPSVFFTDLGSMRTTWYTAVPAIHQAVLKYIMLKGDVVNRHSLRLIRSATSALPPRIMSELENMFNVPVVESYGMTEAASQITSNPLPPGKRKPGSAGLAVGVTLKILGEEGEWLPAGQSGEIAIRGINVMGGYETAADSSSSAVRDGWFRTGDFGYLDSEGYLFITGRLKEMISRGGEKISPREIDEALIEHADVLPAAAFAVSHPTLGEDIAVAVVLTEQATVTEQELRVFAFNRLADFKVPSQVFIVDEIPKGPTGKPNRTALAERIQAQRRDEDVATQNASQVLVSSVFSEVLGVECAGKNDNIFALGGDSLTAMRAVARIQNMLQVDMAISALFRHPTVAELATFVEEIMTDYDRSPDTVFSVKRPDDYESR